MEPGHAGEINLHNITVVFPSLEKNLGTDIVVARIADQGPGDEERRTDYQNDGNQEPGPPAFQPGDNTPPNKGRSIFVSNEGDN
jgi:hypothetical protein